MKNTSIQHYNIGQLRIDTWNILKYTLTPLSEKSRDGKKKHETRKNAWEALDKLASIEKFYAFPGIRSVREIKEILRLEEYRYASRKTNEIIQRLVSDSYRFENSKISNEQDAQSEHDDPATIVETSDKKYFEVLLVDEMISENETDLRNRFQEIPTEEDQFIYDLVIQPTFQDALITLFFNPNIQAVVVRYGPTFHSINMTTWIEPYIQDILKIDFSHLPEAELGPGLAEQVKIIRPELDIYYITDTGLTHLKDQTLTNFNRIFYRREDLQELHLSIIRGIRDRYETPFFSALANYSKKPTGVFHAMPLSRGNSVFKSNWIQDFGKFYGRNMFLAETSATTGGLDSLLQPTGPLKKAQELAAKTYGSHQTFFVTNGTSTANKIVQQALVEPADVVLIDRDCHKSHHYGLVLAGAYPIYLDSYPIEKYSMYGAVPLTTIREKLLELKEAGKLDKIKMLLLTNCTFDGLVYNVERVMEETLAIKPDMIFLWDEAWFAFARFTYTYRQRTGMFVADKLYHKYHSPAYREQYKNHIKSLKDDQAPTLPDPDKVKLRVYSTQSTHKTLSSFRQGSMIHVWDEDFQRKVSESFDEAYMTHTSTSPNYQILASLDAGRRQAQFEGFEMVEKSIEMAMVLRAKIVEHPLLKKYFEVLTVEDFIPRKFRKSDLGEYYRADKGWNRMEASWAQDEFVLDPTKITLSIGKAGIDGDTFKNEYLMNLFNLQINKTSRNTVLFMTNIGTTRSSVAYLINALLRIARKLEGAHAAMNAKEREIHDKKVHSLTEVYPPLPDFSRFHNFFRTAPGIPGGNIREAYFLSYQGDNCEYIPLNKCLDIIKNGRQLVAATFVIPYPPGFPILVPGQVISEEIIEFLLELDVKEIHGYRPQLGLKIYQDNVLKESSKGDQGSRSVKSKRKSRKPGKSRKKEKSQMS